MKEGLGVISSFERNAGVKTGGKQSYQQTFFVFEITPRFIAVHLSEYLSFNISIHIDAISHVCDDSLGLIQKIHCTLNHSSKPIQS